MHADTETTKSNLMYSACICENSVLQVDRLVASLLGSSFSLFIIYYHCYFDAFVWF